MSTEPDAAQAPMNDIAEKAMRLLAVARRKIADWALAEFGFLGFALACVVVVAGGRVAAGSPTTSLSTWFGLQDAHGLHVKWVPATIMFAGLAALVVVWLCVAAYVRRGRESERAVWTIAAAWAAPFALGPPLMDTTLSSYAGFGLLQRAGIDPYHAGVDRLGDAAVVAAVDPSARATPSGVGPLGTVLQHLAVSISSGSALGAVIALRVLAVLAVVVIGRCAADLAGNRRSRALALTVLNPLVLLYFVSAAHLDAVMVALALAALTQANHRRWTSAVALACVAGSVSAQGFIVVGVIIVGHAVSRTARPASSRWPLVLRDLSVAAATTAVIGVAVPDGFGWLSTVREQFGAHTPYSVAGAISIAMSAIVRVASYDDVAAGARTTVITAATCAVVWILVTARRRSVERSAGYALLAVGLLAPIFSPWYVLWGALCLAPTATGTRRVLLLAACAAACLVMPPGFGKVTQEILTAVALLAVVGVSAVALARRKRQALAEAEVSAES